MAHKAKDLVKNQKILSNPNPCRLLSTNVNYIKDFCKFDYISCIMPGKEIFYLSGRVINKFMSKSDYFEKAYQQRKASRLSSQNLLNIVHSTELVAGVGGTHAVCDCNINQNVNLMMIGGKIRC